MERKHSIALWKTAEAPERAGKASGLELSPLKVGLRVTVQKAVCFPEITGKNACRRIPTGKKGIPLFNKVGCLPGSKKGKCGPKSL